MWLVYLMVFVALIVLPWFLFHIQTDEQKKQNNAQALKISHIVFLFWAVATILYYFFGKK